MLDHAPGTEVEFAEVAHQGQFRRSLADCITAKRGKPHAQSNHRNSLCSVHWLCLGNLVPYAQNFGIGSIRRGATPGKDAVGRAQSPPSQGRHDGRPTNSPSDGSVNTRFPFGDARDIRALDLLNLGVLAGTRLQGFCTSSSIHCNRNSLEPLSKANLATSPLLAGCPASDSGLRGLAPFLLTSRFVHLWPCSNSAGFLSQLFPFRSAAHPSLQRDGRDGPRGFHPCCVLCGKAGICRGLSCLAAPPAICFITLQSVSNHILHLRAMPSFNPQ